MLNTVFLQCLGLLIFCESLCVGDPQQDTSHGSSATYLEDDLFLRFQVWSANDSTANCNLALSKPGVSVAVSYRTDPDSDSWIFLEPLTAATLDASSCVNQSVTRRLKFSTDVQFRFVQEEHAGGYCSCWGISDLAIVHNGTTYSINASENLCSNTGKNLSNLTGCDKSIDLVLCGGSASVPRGMVTRFITVSPSVTGMSNCSDGQLVDDMGASPLCDSDILDTPYISVRFQLHLFQSKNDGCNNSVDSFDEGVELSVKSCEGDHWIPLVFYIATTKQTPHPISVGAENNSILSVRGYSVPIELINSSTTRDFRTVLICGNDFLKGGVQFRWLQTVRVGSQLLKKKDVWSLDNVTVGVHINRTHERQVLSEDFDEENTTFRVKAGSVSDGACSLSGQSLVFGLEKPIAEFESRIGVTPPLDLKLCTESTSNTLLPACVEGPVSHPSSSYSPFPSPALSFSSSSPSFSSPSPSFSSPSSFFSSPSPSFSSTSSFFSSPSPSFSSTSSFFSSSSPSFSSPSSFLSSPSPSFSSTSPSFSPFPTFSPSPSFSSSPSSSFFLSPSASFFTFSPIFSSSSYFPPTLFFSTSLLSSSSFHSYPFPTSSLSLPSPSFISHSPFSSSPFSPSPTSSFSSPSPSSPSSCSPSPTFSTPTGLCENSTDPSLFRSVGTFLNNFTRDNYNQVLNITSMAVRAAVTDKQKQTAINLAIVAAAFAESTKVINELTNIPNATVEDLITVLEDLQKWNVDVLRTNISNIVYSFERIVSTFAQQLIIGNPFTVMTENIFFVAELQSHTELATNGKSFCYIYLLQQSHTELATNGTDFCYIYLLQQLHIELATNGTSFRSSDQTGSIISTLNANETAAVFLPASLFNLTQNRSKLGIYFNVYNSGVLFPVKNETQSLGSNSSVTTVIGSPVLAATVGPMLNFSGLVESVRILLRLNEELENITNPRCVAWDFDLEDWTTEGCETDVNGEVIACSCNHLTNFAILVDICSRFQECKPSGVPETVLEVLTIIGVVLSLIGIVATVITLLLFKKLRKRDTTKFHIQLCIALFCMLIVFVAGIDKTDVYGGCVTASALIHYFTLVAVMWMGAEAVLMFQKLIIVFHQTTTKFILIVSFICWLIPVIPVVIPLAVDLSDAVSRNLVIWNSTAEMRGFCFIYDRAVFLGAFLGPIFAILLFNVVIFIMVIWVLIKHTRNKLDRTKAQMTKKDAIILLISTASIMFLFGLTWLIGALTITGFADSRASTALQILFVILNASQGFFIFLFFCVLSKDARESWLELMPCVQHKAKPLRSSQASKSILKAGTFTSAVFSKSEYNSSTDNLSKERYTDIPLHLTATEPKEKLSVVKDDLESPDLEEKDKRAGTK